jgi:hypothetical protein
VFPRLLAHSASVRELVMELQSQHGRLHAGWRRLRPLLAGIASGQRANLPPGLVHEVQEAYGRHIALEDEMLLPLCGDLLSDDDLAAIGREMAARRASSGGT